MKYFKNLNRGQYAEAKLIAVFNHLPNHVVSDIGSGFGWFKPILDKLNLTWQPFDYIKKIEEASLWNLEDKPPVGVIKPGFIICMEVLEHLSNPELGIRHISQHIENGGYMVITTPNPMSAQSKWSLLVKNNLYAFQPKHLEEHHVFVPLPHVMTFHLENNGFEIIEQATLGRIPVPEFAFTFSYFKNMTNYLLLKGICLLQPSSNGHTQAFFCIKKISQDLF